MNWIWCILPVVFITTVPQTGNGQQFNAGTRLTSLTSTSKIIRFYGKSYVQYDFSHLMDEILTAADNETFSMEFITQTADGLIWIWKGTGGRKMHFSLKSGTLFFVIDDGRGNPQQVRIQHPDSRVLSDLKWHKIRVDKNGRQLKFYIDEQLATQVTANTDVQFLTSGATLYIGGSNNTRVDTGALVDTNFDGALVDVEAKKVRGNKELIVRFLQYVGDSTGDITIYDKEKWNDPNFSWGNSHPAPATPPPPPRQPPPVTFKTRSAMLLVSDPLDMRTGGSMSFRFRTLEPRGILAMGHGSAVQFFGIEVYDGILYFVADFGTATSRNQFSDRRVDDGEWHEVTMRVDRNTRTVTLSLDGRQFVVTVSTEELQRLYFIKTYFGGYDNYESAPWPLYSREGFKGCFESLVINGDGLDLHRLINTQRLEGIEFGCSAMARACQTQPCAYGYCRDRMNGYVCDCANTPYTGQNCNANAVIAGWDGSKGDAFNFLNREVTHTNDLSVRFNTTLRDTLLFRTEADIKDDYIQAELVDGKVKVTIKVDGNVKTFFTGKNLNDYFWHTLYIRRRADDVQVWVDDEDKMSGVIGGENYKLYIDRIMFGSVGNKGELRANNYIGFMQNFIYDDKEIFNLMRAQNTNPNVKWFIEPFDKLPLLTYKPITITSSDTFFQLVSMSSGLTMNILFKFKTRESNGLILYNTGRGSDAIAVEMSNGQLRLAYNIGGRNQFTVVPTGPLNDNIWHTVQVVLNERGQFTVRVDNENVQVSTSGSLSLAGELYIGGMPQAMFSRSEVASLIESRKGFRGCLASVDLNGAVPDLMRFATDKSKILDSCTDLNVQCAPNACAMGMCVPRVNDYYCDCNMTGYVGVPCTDHPTGYYFGKNGGAGIVLYEFPLERQLNSNEDMLAFGFMTLERDGVLYRIESSLDTNEYIEIRLENGHIVAESNTGSGLVKLVENSRLFNDGQYHVVRYIRTGSNSTLQVNQLPTMVAVNTGAVSLFRRVHRVMLGGRVDSSGTINRNYYGIIGGAYYNGHRWLDLLLSKTLLHGKLVQIRGDVVLTKPFLLGVGGKTTPAPPDLVIVPGVTIPGDIGGGGIIGPGVGGVGGNVGIPSVGGPGGVLPPITGIYVGPGVPVTGAVASAGVGPAGMMGGARAGAVVGTVLGTMAFLTSLMWALYKLKPGVPTCLSPGAGAGGGGAGMSISSPRTASNLGAVQAASAGAGGGSGGGAGLSASGANGAMTKVTIVNGSAAGGGAGGAGAGAGGGNSTYTSYFQSTSTTVGGGGAGGSAGGVAGGGGMDAVDASTLRATGTFSNKGTAIGSPTGARRNNMSSSAYSSNYQSNTMQSYGSGGANTMQSYGSGGGGGGTMDRGYTGQYLSQSSGDGIPDYDMPVAGTLASGQSYSSSTLNTHYNYQKTLTSLKVQNLKTVTINKQGQYVMSSGMASGGTVTPGAAADEVRVDCCLMTSDGRNVVTGSSLGPPQVWDMQNGELQNIMKGDTIGSTHLHLVCGDRLLVGAVHADMEINEYSCRKGVVNHTLQIWDFMTGRPLSMAEGEYCSAICPMSDSDKVLFGRTDKFGDATSIIAWDLMGNQMIKEMRYDAPVGNNDYISYLNKSKNDRYIVAGFTNSFDNNAEFMTFDMTLTSYNISEPAMLKLDANPEVTAILPKDEAVTGLRNGDLVIWGIRNAQPSRQLLGSGGAHAHTREVKCVSLSEDGHYLVSGSADGTLKVWDMHTERPVQTLQGHTDEVWCTAISSDNEIVVSGSADGTIRLWRVKNGTEMCVFNCGVDIFYVTMSRDKGTIVALGDKFLARKLIMLQVVRTKIKKIVSS